MLKELDKYRLDEIQKQALINALDGVDGEIYLFGSRVDLNKKGGDVDILIFSKDNPYYLSTEIKRKYFLNCEESIDVVVCNNENLTAIQEAFLSTINKVKLN